MKRSFLAAALGILLAAPAGADVTTTAMSTAKGLGRTGGGDTITYIKGMKMRSDASLGGAMVTTIFDVGAQKMTVIDHKKKEVDIYDMAALTKDLQKVTEADVAVQMNPTGQSKTILGQSTDEYSLSISVAASPIPDQKINVVLTGPVWIAKNAPGKADYAAFYRAAADKGFIFSDPRVAKAQPGQAKGMAAMYRAMADAGVPYASDIEIKFEGSGMMAAMMNKMGGMTMGSLVKSISTDPIGDDRFAIPAGYRVKENK